MTRLGRSPSGWSRPWTRRIRLALQDALVAAVEEITCELAPGSVELRLRGRDPEFVVTLPRLTSRGRAWSSRQAD